MPQRLAQHLIARGLLPARVVDEALRRLGREGGTLDTVLLEMGAVSEAGILQAISDVSGVRLVNLADFEPNSEAGPLMPFKMARQLNVVPLSVDGTSLHIACAYPLQQTQLKDVGFLLGRKLELWVALEARIRDWQQVLYAEKAEPRYAKLLSQLDPSRPKFVEPGPAQSLSEDVQDRISRGIVDEPVLLDKPKPRKSAPTPKPKPTIEIVDEPVAPTVSALPPVALGEGELSQTSVIDVTAYSRFARTGHEKVETSASPELGLDELSSTRVMDLRGYNAFAKEVSSSTSEAAPSMPKSEPPPPPRISFPGGVLPPRKPTTEVPAKKTDAPVAFVQPASAPRPSVEKVRPAERKAVPPPPKPTGPVITSAPVEPPPAPSGPTVIVADLAEPPPPAPTPSFDETDFSDVNEVVSSPGAPPVIPPEPPPVLPQEAATPPDYSHQALQPAPEPLPQPVVEAPAPVVDYAQPGILPAPPGLTASTATEWSLAQARAALKASVHDRDALINVVLEYARRTFEYAGSFAVMRGAAVGWDARGDGEVAAIRQLAIPLDAASVFRTVALTRGSYVGPLPPDALSQHYLALLGRMPRTVFLWPVEVQSRLVAMLYGDCGARPISQRRLADFILFCQDLPTAFHELILFRKQNPRAPQQFASTSGIMQDPGYAEDGAASHAPGDAEWFNGLITLLTGPDPSERSMAMMEFMKTPDASAQALATAFPGPTGWSRLPVVELPEPDELGPVPGALARLGQAGALAIAPLLDHSDSDTRYLALLTAGSLRYPDVVDGVLR
ncbi:MAG: FrgA protein, partial [Archangium sp.]